MEIMEYPEVPEYRIYASSRGPYPVIWQAWGQDGLRAMLEVVRRTYPKDTLYVRQVLETVVMVVHPDGTEQILGS